MRYPACQRREGRWDSLSKGRSARGGGYGLSWVQLRFQTDLAHGTKPRGHTEVPSSTDPQGPRSASRLSVRPACWVGSSPTSGLSTPGAQVQCASQEAAPSCSERQLQDPCPSLGSSPQSAPHLTAAHCPGHLQRSRSKAGPHSPPGLSVNPPVTGALEGKGPSLSTVARPQAGPSGGTCPNS